MTHRPELHNRRYIAQPYGHDETYGRICSRYEGKRADADGPGADAGDDRWRPMTTMPSTMLASSVVDNQPVRTFYSAHNARGRPLRRTTAPTSWRPPGLESAWRPTGNITTA